jgi:glycosyltransferase involved in cell wall biosynthesis
VTKKLFLFAWPSAYGGADTKSHHLLRLLRDSFDITVVPNSPQLLEPGTWTRNLDELHIRYARLNELPMRLDGVALAICNDLFFSNGICQFAKSAGLKVVWSSEMMWHHPGEREAIAAGLVDRLLYVSEIQKRTLDYESFCQVPTRITGNYIDPAEFPFFKRGDRSLTIGRLSRAAPEKYPEDFPVFYEALDVPQARFRIMAWSDELARKYRWHCFDNRWTLLPPQAETQVEFLKSLDLFIYPLGHRFTETWGRSTVEAMLTGAIPLVPAGHTFEQLIVPGKTGFICGDFREYQRHAHELSSDQEFRAEMSRACHEHALAKLCDREGHLKVWREALDV